MYKSSSPSLGPGFARRSITLGVLAACGATLLVAGTPAAQANGNLNQPTFSANPTAGSPMTIQVSGTTDEPSTLYITYSVGANCGGSGRLPIDTRNGVIGSFSFPETFTPAEPGPHCAHLSLVGARGTSGVDTSFDVAPGIPAGAPAGRPGGTSGPSVAGGTPSKRKAPPLALAAVFHRAGTGRGLEVAVHLRARANVVIELLLGAYTAGRLHIRGRADPGTHGRYVRIAQVSLDGAEPGWRREIIRLSNAIDARLRGAGPVKLEARVTMTGAGRQTQVLTLRRLFGF
jgi:hypothetical protein